MFEFFKELWNMPGILLWVGKFIKNTCFLAGFIWLYLLVLPSPICYPPFDFFPLNSTDIFQSELFSSGHSYFFPRFQNTRKVFKQIFRLRCKCLSVFGEYVEVSKPMWRIRPTSLGTLYYTKLSPNARNCFKVFKE